MPKKMSATGLWHYMPNKKSILKVAHSKISSARENQVSEYIGSGGVASYMKLGTVAEIRKNGAVGMISHKATNNNFWSHA